MKIKLILYASVIKEAVKAETFLKGQIDKAVKEGAQNLAYQETVGDEEVHERKLDRSIITSLSSLKAELANYLGDSLSSQGTNVYSEMDRADENKIYLFLEVSKRFNRSLIDPLAKMCSKYIEDNCVSLWYGALGAFDQVKYYQGIVVADMLEIKNCISKTAPISAIIPYTRNLEVSGSQITMMAGEETDITYTIDDDAIDDIDAMASNKCVSVHNKPDGFVVKAERPGLCNVIVYSRHDEVNVNKTIDIIVTEAS